MKKNLLCMLACLCIMECTHAQVLSPQAQLLYNETFAHDITRGNFAIAQGAQFFSSPDSSSFYLVWYPPGTSPDTLPMVVTMHGSTGNVFDEFYLWHPYLASRSCAIVAVQWYMGSSAVPPADYLEDSTIYDMMEHALTQLSYPQNKALLHGFSRGSARSYAINLYDALSGHQYFCTTISNSGSAELAYPLYAAVNAGAYGPTPFAGRRWALYCGELDSAYTISGCPAMTGTQGWLAAHGAVVDVFIQDPTGTHGGFHMNSANVDSILNYYMECFETGFMSAKPADEMVSPVLYPNPATDQIRIGFPSDMLSMVVCKVFDARGVMVAALYGSSVIDVSALAKGIYWVQWEYAGVHSGVARFVKN